MIKKILLGILVMLIILFTWAAVYIWQFDPDSYRAELERQIQQATGFDAVISGGINMQTSPDLRLQANHVRLGSDGRDYLNLEALTVSAAWGPLLHRELQIKNVLLDNVKINLWQDGEGNLLLPSPPAVSKPPQPPAAGAVALPLNRVIIDQLNISTLQFSLQRLGDAPETVLQLDDVDFELRGMLIAENARLLINHWPAYLEQVVLAADVSIKEITAANHGFQDISLRATNSGSLIKLDSTMNAYGGAVSGQSTINWLADEVSLETDLDVRTMRLSQLLQAFELQQRGEGLLRLDLDAATTLTTPVSADWLSDLAGTAVLEGDGLVIDGLDVDRLINSLLKSQEMTLTDIGGFALAGPLALLVTKGGNYTAALQGALAGKTQIPALRSELLIAEEKVQLSDVAFSTDDHRIAVSGHLDLVEQSFGPIAVHILNDTGCELFGTTIKGALQSPEIGVAEMAAASIINPLLSLAKKSTDLVTECKPVYEGQVTHPTTSSPPADTIQEH